MRVLVTGFSACRGGIEAFLINYIKVIKTFEKEVCFDVLGHEKHPAFEKELREFGGEIYTIPSPRHADSRKRLDEFFQRHAGKYDVLWCNKCDLANIDYLRAAKKYNIKKRIIHSHNSANMHNGIRRIVFQLLHNMNKRKIGLYATDFWACSDYAAKWFYNKDIIDSDKYCFIPNAIDVNSFAFSETVRNEYRDKLKLKDEILIGNVGRFSYQKNHEFLIQIFSEFLKIHSDAKLLLIGVGELEETIKEKVKNIGIDQSVIFMGKSTEVPKWMQAMDCFLLPSRFEGLPVVAVEAQAAGLPIFAASDGITPQTKLTNNFHFISLESDAKVWAQKISEEKLVHEDHQKEIQQNGFDIQTAAKHLWSLLCKIQ